MHYCRKRKNLILNSIALTQLFHVDVRKPNQKDNIPKSEYFLPMQLILTLKVVYHLGFERLCD